MVAVYTVISFRFSCGALFCAAQDGPGSAACGSVTMASKCFPVLPPPDRATSGSTPPRPAPRFQHATLLARPLAAAWLLPACDSNEWGSIRGPL